MTGFARDNSQNFIPLIVLFNKQSQFAANFTIYASSPLLYSSQVN